jgi:hypothetical protein
MAREFQIGTIATKVGATPRVGTEAGRERCAGMTIPKKARKDVSDREMDDRWAWAVIGLIVGCVTLVLWVPLLKQFLG